MSEFNSCVVNIVNIVNMIRPRRMKFSRLNLERDGKYIDWIEKIASGKESVTENNMRVLDNLLGEYPKKMVGKDPPQRAIVEQTQNALQSVIESAKKLLVVLGGVDELPVLDDVGELGFWTTAKPGEPPDEITDLSLKLQLPN